MDYWFHKDCDDFDCPSNTGTASFFECKKNSPYRKEINSSELIDQNLNLKETVDILREKLKIIYIFVFVQQVVFWSFMILEKY
jgi:hypothetical protein